MRRWGRVDQTADRAVFRQIADVLRADIQTGRLQPGDWLPSEAHLCAEFQVGRNSVRSALHALVGEGLLTSRAGKGHQVRELVDQAVVMVGPGARITTRMPTDAERRELRLPEGTPLLIVEQGGRIRLFPGDRFAIEVDKEATS